MTPLATKPCRAACWFACQGRVTSLVTKKDRVLADRLKYALERDEPLDGVSADPDVLPPSQVCSAGPATHVWLMLTVASWRRRPASQMPSARAQPAVGLDAGRCCSLTHRA
jgi:hypothetical protein